MYMYNQLLQLPAVRQSTFEISWPVVVPELTRKDKDDFVDVSKIPPAGSGTGGQVFALDPFTWKNFSRHENMGEIALRLLRESWNHFKELTLRDWVDDVLQVPSVKVGHLRLSYNRLAFSYMTFLRDVPDITKYHSLAPTVQNHDRFLHASLLHGLTCAQSDKPYETLALDTSPITTPLRNLLGSSEACGTECVITILEARYSRYCRGSDLARGLSFQTATPLLSLVLNQPTADASRTITRGAIHSFRQMSLLGFTNGDYHLTAIAHRWSFLCHEAEEITASRRLIAKLMGLARVILPALFAFRLSMPGPQLTFCNRRISTTSETFSHLQQFCRLSDGGVEIEPSLAGFLDDGHNYRTYRLKLHQEPCLPFIYTFIKELKRGNREAARGIFSFVSYEPIYADSR